MSDRQLARRLRPGATVSIALAIAIATMTLGARAADTVTGWPSFNRTLASYRFAPFDQIMEVGCSGVETAGLMEAASKVNYGKK